MRDSFIDIEIDEKEFAETLRTLNRLEEDTFTPRYMKNVQSRYARPIVNEMKRECPSVSLVPMISISTAKRRTGKFGIVLGVVKNDASAFPKLSAPALASIIEYGTGLRYWESGKSTGRMPEKPFLRPAWDRNREEFMDDVEDALTRKFNKEIRK